jgi:glucuronide carrier protein
MKLNLRQYLGYGAGDFANNLTFSLASSFLLIYYTDVAGIAAGAAGTLFLIVRVWSGFTDLFAGRIVDSTSTRWGKFRPYVLFGALPLLAVTVALFSVPSGLGTGAKLGYAYLTYALFGLAYSLVNIAYGSLSAAMTQVPEERARLSTARSLAASLAILLLAVVVSPQVSRSSDLQRSLTLTTIGIAVVGFALFVFCFSTSRETVERDAAKVSLRDTVAMLRHNRPLILLCGSCILFLTGMFAYQTVAVYYARDVLGNADLYIVMTVVLTAGTIAAAFVVPPLIEAIGKKRAFMLGGLIAAAAGLGAAFTPGSLPVIGVACFGVLGFGQGMVNTLIFALQADTVDYGEWQTGTRAEGSNYSVLSFTRKVGQGVGGAIAAYTIGLGGYVSNTAVQTDSAVISIRVAVGIIPGVVFLLAAAVMSAYPLTEKAYRSLIAEVAARRANRAVAAEPPAPPSTQDALV